MHRSSPPVEKICANGLSKVVRKHEKPVSLKLRRVLNCGYFWGFRSLFLPLKPARPTNPSKPIHSQSESVSAAVVLYALLLIPVLAGAPFPVTPTPVLPVILFGVFIPPVFPAPMVPPASADAVTLIVTVSMKANIIAFNFFNLKTPYLYSFTPCNIINLRKIIQTTALINQKRFAPLFVIQIITPLCKRGGREVGPLV